jgi:glucose-6-phosphate isomerase
MGRRFLANRLYFRLRKLEPSKSEALELTEYSHQTDACFANAIGASGLEASRYAALLAQTMPALQNIREWRENGSLPLLTLPFQRDDFDDMTLVSDRFRKDFDNVIVLGTGGSSLGGKSLHALADSGFGPRPGLPKIYFLDNVDPARFNSLVDPLNLSRTGLLTISKSGGTAETLALTAVFLTRYIDTLGKDAPAKHIVAITEAANNPLRTLAMRYDIPTLEHDPLVGGRYAVLSIVGLLPAMIAGLDGVAIREGAAAVLNATLTAEDPAESAPAVGAAISVGLARDCGIATTVIMPYRDQLAELAAWHRQLWAESLGKDGMGTTPINALGTVDQHSQLQLYLDGPADKMFTIIHSAAGDFGEPVAPDLFPEDDLDYLKGRRMGDLLDACCRATCETLAARGRPVRVMTMDAVNERSMGALMMHFMLETIISAHLLGVDPFDQPAVEEGKHLARRYMNDISPVS